MNGAVQENGDGLFEFGKHSHEKEYPKDHVPKEAVNFEEGALKVSSMSKRNTLIS